MDSGAGDYERLWLTTTLRGVICGNVKVKVLNEGVHSGDSSGVVPSSFRILRQLLNRLDNVETGLVHDAFHVNIPPERYEEAYVINNKKSFKMTFHIKFLLNLILFYYIEWL